MAETIFLDKSALASSGILERLEKKRKAKKHRLFRLTVATGVTLAHIAVVILLVRTTLIAITREKPPVETQLLWLLLPPAPNSPGTQSERQAADMVKQAYKAVQLLPLVQSKEVRPNAITIDPGLALGQAMACGAGKFEYLTRDGQAHCISKPWKYTFDQYGYIILDTSPQEKKKKEEKLRPSDVMAHQRYSAPVCLVPNAPCAERIINGN